MTKIIRIGDILGFDDAEIIEVEEENEESSNKGENK